MGHKKSKFKYKLGLYYGNNHSIFNLNLDKFFDKLRSIFGQFMSKLGQLVNLLDSTWWLFQQKKLNFGCEQVEIKSVQDDFWTLQVEYRTVKDNDSTKSGENFGQYKTNLATN